MEQVCHFCSSNVTKQKWKCHVFIFLKLIILLQTHAIGWIDVVMLGWPRFLKETVPTFWCFSEKSAYEWIIYSYLFDVSFERLCLSYRLWASCRLHLWLCLCLFCLLLMESCTTSLTSSEDTLSPHTQLLVSTNTHYICMHEQYFPSRIKALTYPCALDCLNINLM